MKKNIRFLIPGLVLLCLSTVLPLQAADDLYGATGVSQISGEDLTIEQMLTYALEDEYLARGEYQKIMEQFGTRRPFVNIIQAEEKHIALLKPLFEKYNIPLPPDRGLELAEVPKNFSETFKIGVAAEVANIAMYERFLSQELPADIRDAFSILLAGSENHLKAFKRGGGANK